MKLKIDSVALKKNFFILKSLIDLYNLGKEFARNIK